MAKKADLQKEIDRLNEELAMRGKGRSKTSTCFIQLNSNETTRNATEEESSREYMKEIVKVMGDNVEKFVEFKDQSHSYTTEYVQNVNLKFALEKSRGRRKKDGTYSKHAGQIHAHALLTLTHKSNIGINYRALQELLGPEFVFRYGHNGYVGVPKFIPENGVEKYITKSKEYNSGYRWTSI